MAMSKSRDDCTLVVSIYLGDCLNDVRLEAWRGRARNAELTPRPLSWRRFSLLSNKKAHFVKSWEMLAAEPDAIRSNIPALGTLYTVRAR